MSSGARFDQLIAAAAALPFAGWDFAAIRGRWRIGDPPWDYRRVVSSHLTAAASLLDLATGGGELLASLAPLPARTSATEGHPPNLPIARRRLEPLGVKVIAATGTALPVPDAAFDLVINRHGAYAADEINRVLRPAGMFVTQQVGGANASALNMALSAPPPPAADWSLDRAASQLAGAGLRITASAESPLPMAFHDIGAVVFYLRAVPWQIPDFTVAAYADALFALHRRIEDNGAFALTAHRFLIEATVPSP